MFGRTNKTYARQPQYWGNPHQEHSFMPYGNPEGLNRQQPLAQQYMNPYWNAMDGQWNNPYMPYGQAGYNPGMPANAYWNQNAMKNNYQKMLFQNPLQPEDDPIYGYYSNQQEYPGFNPYPQQAFMPKQPTGMQSIMNSFKGQDGSLDLNKMVDTAGQMVNAVTQVSSLVKGLGGMFKV